MSMSSIESELSSIEKIIDLLITLPAKIEDGIWKNNARTIIKKMRSLYFVKNEIFGLLQRFADGEDIPETEIKNALENFSSYDKEVKEAIIYIKEKCKIENINISHSEYDLLELILHDKTVIRKKIRNILEIILNEQDLKIIKRARKDAKDICTSIANLNSNFIKAETFLL